MNFVEFGQVYLAGHELLQFVEIEDLGGCVTIVLSQYEVQTETFECVRFVRRTIRDSIRRIQCILDTYLSQNSHRLLVRNFSLERLHGEESKPFRFIKGLNFRLSEGTCKTIKKLSLGLLNEKGEFKFRTKTPKTVYPGESPCNRSAPS